MKKHDIKLGMIVEDTKESIWDDEPKYRMFISVDNKGYCTLNSNNKNNFSEYWTTSFPDFKDLKYYKKVT